MKINRKYKLSMVSKACLIALGASGFTMPAFSEESSDKPKEQTEVIEVTGIRSSLAHALQDKRNAESIQDGIAAEDIGKFPDQNVAESLQRISGVAISRENGEGSKLTVRGFGPEFNLVQYNGRTLASTGRGRSFDFQILPSELIAGANVVKAPTAQTPAGAIGGYVNVITARALNKPGFQIAGSVKAKYNDLSENTDPQGSLVLSNTFLDDSIGLVLGVTHKEGSNRIDQVRTNRWSRVKASNVSGDITDLQGNAINDPAGEYWYPGRYRFNLIEEERERTGANMVLEYAQGDNIVHTIDYLYSDFKRNEFRQGMQVPLQRGGWANLVVSDNMTAMSADKLAFANNKGKVTGQVWDGQFGNSGGESETEAIGYNFIGYFDKLTVSFDASHSTADEIENEFNFVPNFVTPLDSEGNQTEYFSYDLRGPGKVATFESNIDIGDPASAVAHFNRLFQNQRSDEITEFKVDFKYELDIGALSSVDFGYATSEREKVDNGFWNPTGCGKGNLVTAPDPVAICGARMNMDDALFSINSGDFLSQESGNFPRDFVVVPDPQAYTEAIGVLQNNAAWADLQARESVSVATEEEKHEAYVKFNLNGEFKNATWRANFGVRHISVENFSQGWGQDRLSISPVEDSQDGFQLETVFGPAKVIERSYDYSRTLPNANFQVDFENGFVINLAASKVMAQPAIQDIGVDTKYNNNRADTFSRSGGNPYLNPYEATQADISFEYYEDNGNAYSLNFFRKDIDTFIDRRTSIDTMPDIIVDGERTDITVEVPDYGNLEELITGPTNRAGGEITGVEIAGLHYFDYLPEMFQGLGLQVNATFLDSKDDEAIPVEVDGVGEPGSGLEGFSEKSYNVIGFYENHGWQVRVAYNWRDSFLLSRNGTNLDPIPLNSKAFGQLDFSVSYDVTDNIKVSLAGVNVTDEKLFEYFGVEERLSRLQYTGSRYTLGVRAKF